jgi:hypothetical protein
MLRSLALTLLAGTLTACGASSRYVVAIARDVDAPTQAIALAIARLQLTVVHGSVPADSVPVWANVLESAAKVTSKGAAVATAAAVAEQCLSSPNDGCEDLTSVRYFKVLEPLTEQQDYVRWSRQRIMRDLGRVQ